MSAHVEYLESLGGEDTKSWTITGWKGELLIRNNFPTLSAAKAFGEQLMTNTINL